MFTKVYLIYSPLESCRFLAYSESTVSMHMGSLFSFDKLSKFRQRSRLFSTKSQRISILLRLWSNIQLGLSCVLSIETYGAFFLAVAVCFIFCCMEYASSVTCSGSSHSTICRAENIFACIYYRGLWKVWYIPFFFLFFFFLFGFLLLTPLTFFPFIQITCVMGIYPWTIISCISPLSLV